MRSPPAPPIAAAIGPPPSHRDRANLNLSVSSPPASSHSPASHSPVASPSPTSSSPASLSPSFSQTLMRPHQGSVPPRPVTARPSPPISAGTSPLASPLGSPSVTRPVVPSAAPSPAGGALSQSAPNAPRPAVGTLRPVTMLAPQGLAQALRQGGPPGLGLGPAPQPGLELKDLRKEAKKRDKRATLSAKDFERKKEKEEREREKKEKEAERERERKEKEERKRKEKEEKDALKAREREEKEAARLLLLNSAASAAAASPASPSSPTVTLATFDSAGEPGAGGGPSWEKKGGSKRRTMLFGKKESSIGPKGGSGIGEQADLRALLESTGGGSAAFGVMSVVAEKKERTFATLNEVLEQGGVNDLKKFIKLHNAAGKLAGEVLNQDGQTALHIACSRYGEEADPSLVKYLLKQKGANPSARDNRQWTPLHCVCQASASASIVNALVHAGADVTSPNVDGTRPLDYFVRHGAKDKELDAFEQALDHLLKGNSVNFKNPTSGETALHSAIRSGHSGNLHTIKLLLARAADVSITNAGGEAPLHYGVKAGRVDIVELLLSAGADPRQGADTDVGSPLVMAERLPESPEKNYILRQLTKQVSLIQAQEVTSPRQLLANKLEEAKERRHFTERMLKAREEEITKLDSQAAEEQQKEQNLQAELDRLKRHHQDLLAQRRGCLP